MTGNRIVLAGASRNTCILDQIKHFHIRLLLGPDFDFMQCNS